MSFTVCTDTDDHERDHKTMNRRERSKQLREAAMSKGQRVLYLTDSEVNARLSCKALEVESPDAISVCSANGALSVSYGSRASVHFASRGRVADDYIDSFDVAIRESEDPEPSICIITTTCNVQWSVPESDQDALADAVEAALTSTGWDSVTLRRVTEFFFLQDGKTWFGYDWVFNKRE